MSVKDSKLDGYKWKRSVKTPSGLLVIRIKVVLGCLSGWVSEYKGVSEIEWML